MEMLFVVWKYSRNTLVPWKWSSFFSNQLSFCRNEVQRAPLLGSYVVQRVLTKPIHLICNLSMFVP